jgi:hypothetical protein
MSPFHGFTPGERVNAGALATSIANTRLSQCPSHSSQPARNLATRVVHSLVSIVVNFAELSICFPTFFARFAPSSTAATHSSNRRAVSALDNFP